MASKGGRVTVEDEAPALPASRPRRRIRSRDLADEVFETIGKGIGKAVKETLAPILKRIEELETRPPGIDHAGTWREGKAYRKGSCVSFGGSLWLVTRDYAESRPGTPNSGFKLIVKTGERKK